MGSHSRTLLVGELFTTSGRRIGQGVGSGDGEETAMGSKQFVKWVSAGLAVGIVVSACSGGGHSSKQKAKSTPVAPVDRSGRNSGPFEIALSTGKPASFSAQSAAFVQGTGLEDTAIAAVIDRLPPFKGGKDSVPFKRPTESIPRPRVGSTIDKPFGGVVKPPVQPTPDGPLQVLRYQPTGDVDLAADLTVTFNHPMVPLGTLAQLDQAAVPVKVKPAMNGRWRWIGTRTLRFEFEGNVDRLPMATKYAVEVPAGTKSQTGSALKETVRWTFQTPPPRVERFAPADQTVGLTQVFIATFDQRIEPKEVIKTITLKADGKTVAVRLATQAEIDADAHVGNNRTIAERIGEDAPSGSVQQIAKDAQPGRWIAFRPVAALKKGAALSISIDKGTPSAEGPRTTAKSVTHRARAYSALKITKADCGYFDVCRANQPIMFTFNNALDAKDFDAKTIKIDPKLDASIGVSGDSLTINGATKANTTYRVVIPASLRDQFGQTLGKDETKSFKVGEPTPALLQFARPLITTDPYAERPSVAVTSVGHETLKVDVYRVDPSQWIEYERFRNRWDGESVPRFDWPRASSTTVTVDGGGRSITETVVDLAADLRGATGHVVVVASPTRTFSKKDDLRHQNRPTFVWVQATAIAVDAMATRNELIAWATNLQDGAPLPGVRIRLATTNNAADTDNDGLARVKLTKTRYITATKGTDVALLPADWLGEWQAWKLTDSVNGFAFNDRGMYRPGEKVHIKGWFRRTYGTDIAVKPLAAAKTATWSAHDSFGTELAHGEVTLSDSSAFDVSFDILNGAALGAAYFQASVNDGGLGASAPAEFQIQEFRRPEFEVVTRAESAGPHLMTSPLTVAATGSYFSGGVLPNAPVTWQVTTSAGSYTPPNRSQFTFGEARPYWMQDYGRGRLAGRRWSADSFEFSDRSQGCCFPERKLNNATYAGKTDSNGTHFLELNFDGEKPDLPVTVSANAALEDVNRQMFGSNLELLVHPSKLYVGLRSTRQFVREGKPLDIEAIVTDIDGEVVVGRAFTVTASRIVSRFENGEWKEVEVDQKRCEIKSSAKPVSCSVDAGIGGQYKISAVVTDDDGGKNRSEFTRWVSGAEAIPSREVTQESATVVPNQEQYRPGETAELLIIAPFAAAEGLATISANNATTTQRFKLENGSALLKVAITNEQVRGVNVQIDLAGSTPRVGNDGKADSRLPKRPAFAAAQIDLRVQPVDQTLKVTAVARDRVTTPGASGTVDVQVTQANGTAVGNADVAVVVVDEAILSLTGYKLADPIAAFYAQRSEDRFVDYLRNTLVLANPDVFGVKNRASTPSTVGATGGGTGLAEEQSRFLSADAAWLKRDSYKPASRETAQGIQERTNFDALALFSPTVRTDAQGVANVKFDLPDNLTRYRVMAVASDGAARFGGGESTLTARIPLQIRPSAPRFANFGDRFEFPVVVQNQTDAAVEADVVIETSNLTLTGSHGQRVKVPANDRVEVRFGVATASAGTARYRVTTASGANADSAGGDFPVYTPVTTEAFATYGVVDGGAIAQPLQTPTGVVPQYGGLEIDTSSTAMQALTDAVVYMEEYEYDSADAYASRIIALTSLRDVFSAFGGEGVPTAARVDARIRNDIKALINLQRNDGGFGRWTREGDEQPYSSVQATEALVLAKLAGFAVSDGARNGALAYTRDIESHFPKEWGAQQRHAVSAYALHVRARAGDRDVAKAESLYRSDSALALDALAWLWPIVDDKTIDAEIARRIANAAHDSPGAATFSHGYDDGAHLIYASNRRTDGIVLDALITKQPQSDLIPKVVAGLIGNQTKGRWGNIQENGFILVALQRYFATFEAQTPSFVARVWLGDEFAAEHAYQGRSIERQHTMVPMRELNNDPNLVIDKAGVGRLYYRLGLKYAPSDFSLDARDEGFVVDRVYEAVNDKGDVRRDADGTWHIKAGAMVRVRVTMISDANHTNMALVDPLPAGLEAVNPVLATSPRPPAQEQGDANLALASGTRPDWCCWTWFDHANLRDDRAEAYSSYLFGGSFTYGYVARATTIGDFVVPPAKAEEIYAPEVFGRSASDRVVVE